MRRDYGQLWDFKFRGNTLEIITPHATTTDKFVSVFLIMQGSEYVVSDGGFVSHGEYAEADMGPSPCYTKLFQHLEQQYAVKQIIDRVGTCIYYKKTAHPARVGSLVLDVASFIVGVVNGSQVSFVSAAETATRRRFVSRANDFMRQVFAHRDIKFNARFNDEKTRYSAIVRHRDHASLINYVTGSDAYYFMNSISKANMTFELLDGTATDAIISHKIALLDDHSDGYQAGAFGGHLRVLRKTGEVVQWSQKEELHALLEG